MAIERTGSQPVFLSIARAIAEGARTGRLPAGTRLPASRALASDLGVHRNTVLAAYRELEAEGFLTTRQGAGTFVAESLPDVRPRRWSGGATGPRHALPGKPGFPFEGPGDSHVPAPFPRGSLVLYGGQPDTRLVPRVAMARAYRRALAGKPDLLAYADPRGEPRLRAALADMLRARRGLNVTADDVLVTRGSQMALSLLGRALIRPGDVVAVEALGYPPAWRALEQPGARLAPVPVDAEGLDVAALAELTQREPVRAVYVTPHHQYPTTVAMSAARRMALLELARRKRFAIIEDDYDHEFHYDGRPILPLSSADDSGVVVYVGTLSKVLAPGLRAGYLVAPRALLEATRELRYDLDRQGDFVTERALAELMEDGELQRHVRRTRRIYQARRDHAVAALRDRLGDVLDFVVPSGGMSLWVNIDASLPVARFHAAAVERGVHFQPGSLFALDRREIQHARIGYGAVTEREMSAAVNALCDAAREVVRGGRRRRE